MNVYKRIFLLFTGFVAVQEILMDTSIAKEYCQWDHFNVSCPHGQVILMERALYGRMQVGSCLQANDHIGCSVDVLNVMDSYCSGKERCYVTIPNEDFHKGLIATCEEMLAYLEAKYTCIGSSSHLFAPTKTDLVHCGPNKPIQIPHFSHGYILGGVNTNNCHLRLEVKKGQQIQVHLYDFNVASRSNQMNYDNSGYDGVGNGNHETSFCEMYALIQDLKTKSEKTICAGKSRYSLILTTKGNSLDILLISEAERHRNFILGYNAVGCPDITPPHDAHVIRQGNKATVKCNFTNNIWHIVCKDTQWVGTISNCSAEQGSQMPKTTWRNPGLTGSNLHSYGLIIAVFIGVLIGAICGFIMLAMVMIYRKRRKRAYGRTLNLKLNNNATNCPNYGVFNSNHCTTHQLGTDRNYTHIWRLQQQRTPPLSAEQYEHQNQQEERMYTMQPMSTDSETENDYERQALPAVTYVCRHNKTYEKPIPQIISDNQRPNTRPNMQTGTTMDIERKRLWVNTGNKNSDSDVQTPKTGDSVNDSGVET